MAADYWNQELTTDHARRDVATGTELITGRVPDFNARYAARRRTKRADRQRITIIGDEPPWFREILLRALGRSRFIIITGGLGATEDDVTVAAAAEALELPLLLDEGLLARIRRSLGTPTLAGTL